MHTSSEGNTIIRDLSSCMTEKFNDFHIVKTDAEFEIRALYSPLDIIYDTMKHGKIKISCFSPQRRIWRINLLIMRTRLKLKLNIVMSINATIVPITMYKKISTIDICKKLRRNTGSFIQFRYPKPRSL